MLASIFTACTNNEPESEIQSSVECDLDAIIENGVLRAAIEFNSVDYFIYKGEPMGFQYEMLQSFADQLDVDLELTIVDKENEAIELLNDGNVDIIAIGLTINSLYKNALTFTEPIMETRQVLVQRKPLNWRQMTQDDLDRQLVRSQLDLAYKTVYVEGNSVYYKRMVSLADEIGDTINVIEVPYKSEKLIEDVVYGDIDYTVADENVALVSSTYYPSIDVSTPVSFLQKEAWGVRSNHSKKLLATLNSWILSYKGTSRYNYLYAKYFKNSRTGIIVNSDYYSLSTGKISKWDDVIKDASQELGWDWRLVSSLVYQESRFDPEVVSWAGAFGLMQVMPVTGDKFGIDVTTATPKENVMAGISYLKWLDNYFLERVPDDKERIKFVLGSYNAGPGHVLDAMRLAEKYDMNPQLWDGNVAYWLLKKSDPEVYRDESVRNGYSRGEESVNYVTEILERYKHYMFISPEESVNKLTQVVR